MTKVTSDIQRLEAVRIASGIYLDPDNSRGVNTNSIKEFIDVANRIYQFIESGQTGDPDVTEDPQLWPENEVERDSDQWDKSYEDQGESVLGFTKENDNGER